ncbi:MAG: HAD family hydrolase [Clostridiales bacterium]|nr:HAD family hydrolase [Clostridiales bacterium]
MIKKRYKKLIDITIQSLIDAQVQCVMLDIDSTLLKWRTQRVQENELTWCSAVQDAGITITLVSNATKSRAEKIALQIDSEFISPAYKPWPFGLLKAARMCAVKKENCIMIGDQILTDRFAAFFAGIRFVLLEPISNVEFGITKVNRFVEKHIMRRKNL